MLTALLVLLLAALVIGARRDIAANRVSLKPERVGLGVAVPLAIGILVLVAVQIAGFRFWDHLVRQTGF
jgi:hypothetical protein